MTLVDQVTREAVERGRRRRVARCLGPEAIVPIARDPVAEVMLAAGPQTPGEAIALCRERWPEVWARVVATARSRRETAGVTMMRAIEQGLDLGEAAG